MCRLLISVILFGVTVGVCSSQVWPYAPNSNSAGDRATAENFPWANNGGAANTAGTATWPTWQNSGSNNCNSNVRRPCGNGAGNGWPFQGDTSSSRCGNSVEATSSEIARVFISASQKMHRFCIVHSNRALSEVYGVEHFKLRVKLSEFSEDSIQVRVRQRLVSIHARSCLSEYAALRILPDVVEAQRAVWMFEGGTLTVLFPYNVEPDTEIESKCGRRIDDGVIIVPKCKDGTVFTSDYDLTFGDAALKRAIRNYLQELVREGKKVNDSSEEAIDNDPW